MTSTSTKVFGPGQSLNAWALCLSLALICLLLSAQLATAGSSGPMQAKMGGTDHYYCTSNDTTQPTIYFSAEFDFSWPPGTVRVQDSVIGNEFKQALAAKYGYQGPVVCFGTKSPQRMTANFTLW